MTSTTDAASRPLTWRRRLLFASIAVFLVVVVMFSAVLGADLYVHHRAERYAGVNIWGYRGPTVGRKQRGEHRIVVLGGSTAFGYGVEWAEAFPAQLEGGLRPLSKNGAPIRVVNLGMNSQGAYSFRFALEDYLGLQYDAAILYEGYNDLGGAPNEFVGRRDSPVFRATGYYPVLHIAIQEKAMALRNGGDIEAAYRGTKTVFRPGLTTRATASTLETAGRIGKTLDEQLARFAAPTNAPAGSKPVLDASDTGCRAKWAHYCRSVSDAVRFALDHGKKILIVTQPYIDDRHRAQQAELRAMLTEHFNDNANVGYVNLGETIDLMNSPLAYDHMHLTREGNAVIARDLVGPVARLMPEAFDAPKPVSVSVK
jgi:hypothetical protein